MFTSTLSCYKYILLEYQIFNPIELDAQRYECLTNTHEHVQRYHNVRHIFSSGAFTTSVVFAIDVVVLALARHHYA